MKFPKEKAVIMNKFKEYLSNEDYISIYKMKSEVMDNIEELKDSDIIIEDDEFTISISALDLFISSCFLVGDINKTILVGEEYQKQGYESFAVTYYMLLAFISNLDIYQSIAYIKRSKLLNQIDIKVFYNNDEANYSRISYLEDDEVYKMLALVMVNLCFDLSKELVIIEELNKEYLLYRLFDVINLMNELGYPHETILKMSDDIRNVFMLEI